MPSAGDHVPPAVPDAEVKIVSIDPWRTVATAEPATRADSRYLLCLAAGVRLAVPMADITHMLPMPPLTPPNTTNPICLGRWRHPSGVARVADLAELSRRWDAQPEIPDTDLPHPKTDLRITPRP